MNPSTTAASNDAPPSVSIIKDEATAPTITPIEVLQSLRAAVTDALIKVQFLKNFSVMDPGLDAEEKKAHEENVHESWIVLMKCLETIDRDANRTAKVLVMAKQDLVELADAKETVARLSGENVELNEDLHDRHVSYLKEMANAARERTRLVTVSMLCVGVSIVAIIALVALIFR